jgi:LacI family transcriptional regulator
MVTQKDVAELAGVSTTTVSHVINETRFVSQELRERVHRAMRQLDYQPNAIAQSLRRRKTHKIAVIVPDIAYPFLAEVIRGIEDQGFQMGYNAILCASHGDLERERACFDLVRTKQVDGLILVGAGEASGRSRRLIEQGTPVVLCNRESRDIDVGTVVADNEGGGYQATRHLWALGHRRIGCVAGPAGLRTSSERLEGYRRALEEFDLTSCRELVIHGDFRSRGGFDAMGALLDLDEPPTAVFACNDLMAIGAICAASKRRLGIPEDIAIIGCDDIALAAFTNPSLTTVALPKHEMGAAAVEMLVARMEDEKKPVEKRVLPVELVIRDSCGYRPRSPSGGFD